MPRLWFPTKKSISRHLQTHFCRRRRSATVDAAPLLLLPPPPPPPALSGHYLARRKKELRIGVHFPDPPPIHTSRSPFLSLFSITTCENNFRSPLSPAALSLALLRTRFSLRCGWAGGSAGVVWGWRCGRVYREIAPLLVLYFIRIVFRK